MVAKPFGPATVVLKSFSVISIVENSDGVRERPESLILMILNVGLLGGTMGSVYFRHSFTNFLFGDWGK
jgi:hypothetical protein